MQATQNNSIIVSPPKAIIVQPSSIGMAETTPPGADVTPKKKRAPRKKKDPNAPAGVTSAYTFFFRARQATIKAQNPGAKFGDVSKIVAQLWEAMSDSEKTEYKKLNEEDKIRHKNQMEAYKAGATFKKGRPSLDDSNTDHEAENEETKEVFSSTTETLQIASHFKVQEEEVMTENMCIKRGCSNLAVKSPEWDDEFCSDECAVGHCKDVFGIWVSEQPQG